MDLVNKTASTKKETQLSCVLWAFGGCVSQRTAGLLALSILWHWGRVIPGGTQNNTKLLNKSKIAQAVALGPLRTGQDVKNLLCCWGEWSFLESLAKGTWRDSRTAPGVLELGIQRIWGLLHPSWKRDPGSLWRGLDCCRSDWCDMEWVHPVPCHAPASGKAEWGDGLLETTLEEMGGTGGAGPSNLGICILPGPRG